MKEYELIQTTDEYPFVIVSTSYANPLPHVFEIKDILLDSNFKGFILVDLLLSNGFNENRFLKVYFDGTNFDIFNSKIESHVSSRLLNDLYSFYIRKPELIENNNILPKAQKHLLLKGSLIR